MKEKQRGRLGEGERCQRGMNTSKGGDWAEKGALEGERGREKGREREGEVGIR
jgi:hypothetical protein